MKKLLSVLLVLCMFANVIGFAEMAETISEEEIEVLETVPETESEERVEEETIVEDEAPAIPEIKVQSAEDGTRLSVACDGEVVWQEQPGSDISEADEEAWVSIADGADYLAAPETDTLYRAIADGVASEPVAVAAVDKTEVSEAVEEAEEAEPILSLNPMEEEPILALENDEDSREVDLQTPEISDTELDEPTPNTPAYVLSGNNVVASGKSVTLTVKQGDTVVKASTLNWKSDNTSIATVSAGKVTAKKVTEVTPVTITATSKTDATLSGSFDITVYPATTKVTITTTKTSIDLDANETLSLEAKSIPENACGKVTWKTSNANIATVTDGVVSPVAVGKVTITATAADGTGKYGTIVLNVIKAVTGITIEGPTKMAAGKSVTLKAVCEPTNATNQKVKWESEQPSVATVSTSGVVKAIRQTEGKTVTIKATSLENGEKIATHTIEICPVVTKVELKADQTFIDFTEGKGKTLQITAACTPEGTSQGVTWKTSNAKIAMVNDNGLVTAEGMGKATITATATDGSGKSGTFVVNVVKAVTGITVEGPEAMLAGKSVTLKATCNPKDATNKKVTWASNDEDGEVTVSTSGVVKASAKMSEKKTVIITATSVENPSITKEHKITVCPAVTAVTITADANRTFIDITDATNENPQKLQLKATCTPDTASQSVTWKTSSTKIATVDENGLVTAVGVGKATITATAADGTGKSKTYVVSVVKGLRTITITGDKEIVTGKTATLKASLEPTTATNKGIKWESKNTTVATVSSAGVVKAAANLKESKTVTITATGTSAENAEVVGSYEIKVCPVATGVTIRADKTLIDLNEENKTLQLTAVCAPEEHAKQGVTWKTNNRVVATVDANGLVTAKSTGKVTITATATDGSGKSGTIELSVVYAVTGITLSSKEESVLDGSTVALTATVAPEGATNKKIVWSSSNEKIATVDASGKVTVKEVENVETVTITAASEENDNFKDTCEITVTPTVKNITIVNPTESNIIDLNGEPTLSLSATVIPAAAAQEVRWTSSNEEVATVDTEGKVTAKSAGKVTITATATDGSNKSGSIELSVVCAVKTIEIEGADTALGGANVQLTAKITPENAANKAVTWSSSDEEVATVDASGKVTIKEVEEVKSVTITATSVENTEKKGEKVITVTPALKSITIDNPSKTDKIDLKNGKTLQLGVTCEPAAANPTITWASSDETVATVDKSSGLVTKVGDGTATFTVTGTDDSGSKNASVTLTFFRAVTDVFANLDEEDMQKVYGGETVQLLAEVFPDDATNKNIVWSTDDNSVATVDQNGNVTLSNPAETVQIMITAASEENEGIYDIRELEVIPKTERIDITTSLPDNVTEINLNERWGWENLPIAAVCYPQGASQEVEWTVTGNAEIVTEQTIEGNDEKRLHFTGTGTVTLTATATDPSKLTATKSFTVTGNADTLSAPSMEVTYTDNAFKIKAYGKLFDGKTELTEGGLRLEKSTTGAEGSYELVKETTIDDENLYKLDTNPIEATPGQKLYLRAYMFTTIDGEEVKSGYVNQTVEPFEEYDYITDGNSICIDRYLGNATDLTIPGTINGLPVTKISAMAFCEGTMTSVSIPNSVTSIGGSTFIGCNNLKTVTIPRVVADNFADVFDGCTGITSVTILEGAKSIKDGTFKGFEALESITLPSSVTLIGEKVFADCKGLKEIKVAVGNPSYCSVDGTLYSADHKKLIKWPKQKGNGTISNGVVSIAANAFDGCEALTEMDIPKGVTDIGRNAFYGCSALTKVTIPEGVKIIPDSMFDSCTALTTVTIPNTVKIIRQYAFLRCGSLKTITIPDSVISVDYMSFGICVGLENVYLGDNAISVVDPADDVFSDGTAPIFHCNEGTKAAEWLLESIAEDKIIYND